ncbi:hypothetical protein VMCG_04880 [Cytospora schulzeri]|uniref:Uncharacterized protein n=1 Tax=Cytospora schulzeri TaxID=448051 RepID=A0A423WMY9_9PEZI|nr:hypothetical protein VMCG_04880 [Valsa malicola]
MEGCGTWTNLLNGCLGWRHKIEDQSVELAPQVNPYGRKLMDRLEKDTAKGAKTVGRSQVGLPKGKLPIDGSALDSSRQPRRPSSQDLVDLVNSSKNTVPIESREHDNAWHEMLNDLHTALKHTRYSVSGRMAMSVWGCSRGARDALSVICPVESRDAVKIWAVSTGGRFTMTDVEPDILTFQSRVSSQSSSSSQPRLWRVRIRWLPERMFEAMPNMEKRLTYNENPYTGEYRTAYVSVLTLPCLLDNSASAWMDSLAKGITQERLEVVAQDILSILDCIMELNFQEEGSGPLSAAECRHVLNKAFWIPFTQLYPLAPVKFAQCGLGLPSYTQSQPGPHGGMVYQEASTRSGAATSTKDAGRNLMVRKPAPECRTKTVVSESPNAEPEIPVQRPPFRDLFITASREETAEVQLERERRKMEDARKLEEQGGKEEVEEKTCSGKEICLRVWPIVFVAVGPS